jgi:hypothetical protein
MHNASIQQNMHNISINLNTKSISIQMVIHNISIQQSTASAEQKQAHKHGNSKACKINYQHTSRDIPSTTQAESTTWTHTKHRKRSENRHIVHGTPSCGRGGRVMCMKVGKGEFSGLSGKRQGRKNDEE